MAVSGQDRVARKLASRAGEDIKGPRARMRKTLLNQALELMEHGSIPSVSDVAEAAEVSRATAYRYFPSQEALIQDAILEALGPILNWESDRDDAGDRVDQLLASSLPRVLQYEAVHRGALRLSMDQWVLIRAGEIDAERRIARGSRRRLLAEALEPIAADLGEAQFDKLTKGLSLIFGIEAIVVLRDIWGMDDDDSLRDVLVWAASAMVQKAIAEAGGRRKTGSTKPRTKAGPRTRQRKNVDA